MGRAVRTVCGPYVSPLKSTVKSYFPKSNANSDCRIGFYAKKYVGHNITGGPVSLFLRRQQRQKKKCHKKWH
jgi:hypothetical protein